MYLVELKPRAIRDLRSVPKPEAQKIVEKIKKLEEGLVGDIKRLTNFTPEYRLRVGDYRVLFEVESQTIVVYRIKHRKEAYSKR
jgi:Cytotoxic translational repressor of toxin-antitoxin stability system